MVRQRESGRWGWGEENGKRERWRGWRMVRERGAWKDMGGGGGGVQKNGDHKMVRWEGGLKKNLIS